jgi:hypothetical protein
MGFKLVALVLVTMHGCENIIHKCNKKIYKDLAGYISSSSFDDLVENYSKTDYCVPRNVNTWARQKHFYLIRVSAGCIFPT